MTACTLVIRHQKREKTNSYISIQGNWPSTLALWFVDSLTVTECRGGNQEDGVEVQGACLGKDGVEQCERMGGTCTVYTDGYYVEVAVCCVIGNS